MAIRIARHRRRLREILEVANPGDVTSRTVDASLVTLVFLSVVAVVIETIEPWHRGYGDAFAAFEVFSVTAFTVEYLARVWCAAPDSDAAPWFERTRARLRFVLTPLAMVDLLAILPFYLFHLGVIAHVDMRVIRVLRLFRVFKLTRYSPAMAGLTAVLRESAQPLGAAFFVLLVVMLLASSGMYVFEHGAQPVDFGSIPAAMWWAFATLTTVGYGDVTPITVGGKIFGAVTTVFGIGIVALPAGILASAYNRYLRRQEETYRGIGRAVFEDGVVTPDEREHLEERRRELGLSEDTAAALLAHLERRRTTNGADEACCPLCGHGRAAAPWPGNVRRPA